MLEILCLGSTIAARTLGRAALVLALTLGASLGAFADESEESAIRRTESVSTEEKSLEKFIFNIPSLVKSVDRIKTSVLNNGQQIKEKYYAGAAQIGYAQYVVFGAYDAASSSAYFDEEEFVYAIRNNNLYKSKLAGGAVETVTWGGDIALQVTKAPCYWLRIAKLIGNNSMRGNMNLLVDIYNCAPLPGTTEDILKIIGLASAKDHLEFAARTRYLYFVRI